MKAKRTELAKNRKRGKWSPTRSPCTAFLPRRRLNNVENECIRECSKYLLGFFFSFLAQNIQCKKTTDSCYNILYFAHSSFRTCLLNFSTLNLSSSCTNEKRRHKECPIRGNYSDFVMEIIPTKSS